MKRLKRLALLLALLLTATAILLCAAAEDEYACGAYRYRLLDDGTAEITSYTGRAETLAVPDCLDGYAVTSIGNGAFAYCTSLTSLTIPDSVTSLGDGTFYNCTSLASIVIPDGVTSIGDYAFADCKSLTSITIPDSVAHMGANPFRMCTKLTRIVISPDHPVLAIFDGVLFDKTKKSSFAIRTHFQRAATSFRRA